MIEKGRYEGLPRAERLCVNCKIIEDEFHFLDKCSMLSENRKKFFDQFCEAERKRNLVYSR